MHWANVPFYNNNLVTTSFPFAHLCKPYHLQVPDNTPVKKANLGESKDSFESDEEEEHMRVTIKPKARPVVSGLGAADGSIPKLAAPIKLLPPPKSPSRQTGYQVQPDRFNPFDKVIIQQTKEFCLVEWTNRIEHSKKMTFFSSDVIRDQ